MSRRHGRECFRGAGEVFAGDGSTEWSNAQFLLDAFFPPRLHFCRHQECVRVLALRAHGNLLRLLFGRGKVPQPAPLRFRRSGEQACVAENGGRGAMRPGSGTTGQTVTRHPPQLAVHVFGGASALLQRGVPEKQRGLCAGGAVREGTGSTRSFGIAERREGTATGREQSAKSDPRVRSRESGTTLPRGRAVGQSFRRVRTQRRGVRAGAGERDLLPSVGTRNLELRT